MKKFLLVIHVLIVLFALQSGIYKVAFGQADVAVFAHLGMSALFTAVFGGIQALAGLATIPRATRRYAAIALAACNGLATIALFASGHGTFGVVSIVFVAMALLVVKRAPRGDGFTAMGPSRTARA